MVGQIKVQAQPEARQALPHRFSGNGDDGVSRFLGQIHGRQQFSRICAVHVDLMRVPQHENAVLGFLEQVVEIRQRIGVDVDGHARLGAKMNYLARIGVQEHVETVFLRNFAHHALGAMTINRLHGHKRNARDDIVAQSLFRFLIVHFFLQRLSCKQWR